MFRKLIHLHFIKSPERHNIYDDFKRGGSNGLKVGVQYICLTRTTNLAYLDAKE